MPYKPILNPVYYHWEPWPHVYRRGAWLNNVTGRQEPPNPSREVIPSLSGLGEVPWQCWDQPGFKDCQQKCFDKAGATDLSADAKSALIETCFNQECVEPCRSRIVTTDAAPSTTTKSIDDLLAKVTPMNIAIAAVAIAIGSTLLLPSKKGRKVKQNKRRGSVFTKMKSCSNNALFQTIKDPNSSKTATRAAYAELRRRLFQKGSRK
jgi:hypothetical protein